YFVFEMRNSPPRFKGLGLIVLFWIWIALACKFAADPSVAMPKVWQFTRIFAIVFLIAAMANSESRIRALLYSIAGSVGLLGAKGGLDFLLTGGSRRMVGPGGLEGEENEYALALNMAIPILVLLSNQEDRTWLRWSLRGAAVGCGLTILGTHSRSGL